MSLSCLFPESVRCKRPGGLRRIDVPGGHDVDAGAADILDHDVADMDRGRTFT